MSLINIIFLSISISVDSFALSLVLGARYSQQGKKQLVFGAMVFAIVQTLLTGLAFLTGTGVRSFVAKYAYIVTAGILVIIALKLLKEGKVKLETVWGDRKPMGKEELPCKTLIHKFVNEASPFAYITTMLIFAVATSIDGLAVGFGVSLIEINAPLLLTSVLVVTFLFCFAAVSIARKFASKERIGGYFYIGGGLILLSQALELLHKYGLF